MWILVTFCLILQIEPSVIADIQFQCPKQGRDIGVLTERPLKKTTIHPPSDEAKEIFQAGLKRVMPVVVVFSSVAPLQQLATRSSVVRKLPAPLNSLQNPKYASMSEEELKRESQQDF